MNSKINWFAGLLCCALLASNSVAADVLIRNARLFTGTEQGVLEGSSILVRNGKIAAVGAQLEAGSGTEDVDAAGAWVTVGLVESSSIVSLTEIESGLGFQDYGVKKSDLTAGFQVSYAVNRFSSFIPMIRAQGITRAILKPDADSTNLAGQMALINLSGTTSMLDVAAGPLVADLRESSLGMSGGSRAKAIMDLLAALNAAQTYQDNRRAYKAGKLKPLPLSEPDLETLSAVLSGDKRLVLYINRAADIETVLKSLDPWQLKIILMGAREAWLVTDALVSRNIPAVLNVLDNLPSSFDQLGARLDNAALLAKAGVKIAFMSESLFTDTNSLTQGAGTAVAYGLDWHEAMKALTVNPAEIWGLKQYGSMVPGNQADIVIWNGDPLEVTSKPGRVMINGEWSSLKTRQTELRDRYKVLETGREPFGYR